MGKKKSYLKFGLLLAAFLVMVWFVPQFANKYYMTVINAGLIYAIAVFGLSLLMGLGGMMSFATVTFMGIGAYATAQFSMTLNWPTLLSIPAAILVSTFAAFVLGLLLLRLKDAYFAFATIGIVQVAYAFFLNYKPITGGPNGLPGVPKLDLGFMKVTSLTQWFYVLAIMALVTGLIVERIRQTKLGRSLEAVRDNEVVAQTLGISVYWTKVTAFVISGAFGGLAGALLAHMNAYLSAYLFTFDISVRFLVMVMLGGVNSTIGSFVGTMLVTMIPEWFRVLQGYMKLIYGLAIVLLMIFMPMGLAGIGEQLMYRLRKARKQASKKEDETDEHANR